MLSKRSSLLLPAIALVLQSIFQAGAGFAQEAPVDFNREIRPILSDTCLKCHGPDANTREADLRLDVESAAKEYAIIAGKAEESPVIERVMSDDEDLKMPPPDSGLSLTDNQKAILKRWINEGAKYQRHWSFEPIRRPDVPANFRSELPIDAFISKRLEQAGTKPLGMASHETQIRRVTLDLTGLPPTVSEVKNFKASIEKDGLETAYENLVDRLLSSPRYGERMAWSWLEAARYADTDGYQNDGPRDMWQWRTWVINAYNQNMSFDQFSIEQLAGDLLPDPSHEQIIATGFNRNNRYNSEAGIPIDEFLLENAVDRVDTTSTVWMGLTMGCARCHDHKYDPFSQKEYYQLIDYFNDVAESGRAIKFGNSEPWIKSPTSEQKTRLESLEQKLESAKKALDDAEAEIESAAIDWATKEKGNVEPVLRSGLTYYFDFDDTNRDVSQKQESSEKPSEDTIVKQNGTASLVDSRFGKSASVSDDGYIELPAISGLIADSRFSIAFWMNPADVKSGAIISNEKNNTLRHGMQIGFDDGHLLWDLNSRWIAGVATLRTKRTFKPGEWVHIVATNDGTQRAKGMKLYVDGELQVVDILRNTNSNKTGAKNHGPMKIGHSHHVGTWTGQLDELRFYRNRTLSGHEAWQLTGYEKIESLVAAGKDRTPEQNAFLRTAYLEQTSSKHAARLKNFEQAQAAYTKFYDSLPTTMVMEDLPDGRPSFVRKRGVYDQLGEKVQPGVPSTFPSIPANARNDRLGFAKWLVNGEHPLTARVAVNRYWQMLFGRGLVVTTEDFGWQGELPSHPELLDWLAAEFMENDWNVKAILKEIVMTKTYRRSSKVTAEMLKADPNNILLARSPRIRLPGNVLRDQALFASGLLIEEIGGPSVKPYQPKNLWKEASNFRYAEGKGDDLYRRSLYTYWKRTLSPPTMALLDTADREWCSVKPKRTNTPLQALTLMNDITFTESARKLAEQTLSLDVKSDAERISHAFQVATARMPTAAELNILSSAIESYRSEFQKSPKEAEKVLKLGKSQVTSESSPVELAATTALMNVLLNLDEVTTRE